MNSQNYIISYKSRNLLKVNFLYKSFLQFLKIYSNIWDLIFYKKVHKRSLKAKVIYFLVDIFLRFILIIVLLLFDILVLFLLRKYNLLIAHTEIEIAFYALIILILFRMIYKFILFFGVFCYITYNPWKFVDLVLRSLKVKEYSLIKIDIKWWKDIVFLMIPIHFIYKFYKKLRASQEDEFYLWAVSVVIFIGIFLVAIVNQSKDIKQFFENTIYIWIIFFIIWYEKKVFLFLIFRFFIKKFKINLYVLYPFVLKWAKRIKNWVRIQNFLFVYER